MSDPRTWVRRSGGEDESYDFGVPVRGIVRTVEAFVYYSPESNSRDGGWTWIAYDRGRGRATDLRAAVTAAETALGITDDGSPSG